MMHILLIILKIIGIALLTVVGLLFLTLLLTLFCPVVYRGRFARAAGSMTGSLSVSWLFRLVWVTVFYDNGEHGFRIKLFGIPLNRGKKENRKSAAAIQKAEKKKDPPDKAKVSEIPGTTKKDEKPEATEKSEAGSETEENVDTAGKKPFFLVAIWRGVVSFFRMLINLPVKIIELPVKILRAVQSFFQKITAALQKMNRFRELLFSEEFTGAFRLARGSAGKLIRHVRPRKIRGYLKFGFDDPCYTGLCLGAVSVIYPWYCRTLKIEPDFRHKELEADLYLRGRVFGVYALYIFIKIYFDKNVKYMINRFRDKEAR